MEFQTLGLVVLILGNLLFLERAVGKLKSDIEHIKKRLCGEEKGDEKE